MPVEELVHAADGLVVRCLRNLGPYENNIFIVSDAASGEAYVLDGGFGKWGLESRTRTRRYPAIEPTAFAPRAFTPDRATREEVQAALGSPLGTARASGSADVDAKASFIAAADSASI